MAVECSFEIREAREDEINAILGVNRRAFGGDVESELVRSILQDPTARPVLNLVATHDEKVVGHILFSNAPVAGPEGIESAILCPMSVEPAAQKQGIGGQLIQAGLQKLKDSGTDLVFVLGHPEYYPRHGFVPAGQKGLLPPYPIKEKNAGAWLVNVLSKRTMVEAGTVQVAKSLDVPELWADPVDVS